MISCGGCMSASTVKLQSVGVGRPALFPSHFTGSCEHLEVDDQHVLKGKGTLYAPLSSIILIGLCPIV